MISEFFLIPTSVLNTRYSGLSSDDLIRARQHIGWNREADLHFHQRCGNRPTLTDSSPPLV